MSVSTRGGGETPSFADGLRGAIRAAAWCAPVLVPFALLQAAFVATPWLDSLEAGAEESLIALAADWRVREIMTEVLESCGHLRGLAVLTCLVTLAWVVVAWARGPFRRRAGHAPSPTDHRAHALRLLAWLFGAGACLVVHSAGAGLDRIVDVVTSLRPTGWPSLVLLAGSQALDVVACAALLGTAFELSRRVHQPRARAGAATAMALLAAAGAAAQLGAISMLASRFDLGRTLADLAGPPRTRETADILVLARDRSWVLPMGDGLDGVRFASEAASRAEALLDERRGWTWLATDAEQFVVGERLFDLDPDGARDRALAAILRRGASASSQPFLVAIGSAAPSPRARQLLDALETAPHLRLGRDALHLIAHAHARHGDVARAKETLARLRSRDGDAWVSQRRNALPLVISTLRNGSVSGRVVVNGAPWRGRVGLVSTRDLFSFPPPGDRVPVTWLLRLVTAVPCDAEGRFVATGLAEGELALVLKLPGRSTRTVRAETPLPRIELSQAAPAVDIGTIRVAANGGPGADSASR